MRVAAIWAGAWTVWLATGLALPAPPWRAAEILAGEESAANALAADPARTSAWSATAGGVQRQAFGLGWGEPERAAGRSFRRTVLATAVVTFASPDWPAPTLRARSGPETEALSVTVAVDGAERGLLRFDAAWSLATLDLGPLARGPHRLELRGAERLTLSFVSVGRADGPEADGGFVQWRAAAAYERPVYFPSAGGAGHVAIPDAGALGGVAESLHGLSAALLLAFVTGLPFACRRFPRDGAAQAAAALAVSALAVVAVFVGLRLLGMEPDPLPVAAGLALVGVAGLASAPRARIAIPGRALLPGLVIAPVLAAFALRVVPPLVDQDVELQGTAHALATRQEPRMVTDRGTTWFFAHPPLLHFLTAGSFALSGRLPRVADADALAREGAAREAFVAPPVGAYPPRYYDLWWRLVERFEREPQLWPTRAVNVVLAAATLAWLAELAARVSGSTLAGLLLAGVLGSFPEFLVRGAYGGYFALEVFASVALLSAVAGAGTGAPALAAALGALGNQKGLLVPVAWLAAAPRRSGRARLVPAIAAAAALLAFAAWGLILDAPSFVHDFLKEHVARRLALGDVRFVHDAAVWYPSIPELWAEFVARYGLVFTLAAGAASVAALRSPLPAVRAAGAAVLLGALAFSLVDWRQTKHLALLAAPAFVAMAGRIPPGGRGRAAAVVLLLAMIALNLAHDAALVADFGALRPSTIW